MKLSRWYMYVIPGGILGTIGLIGLAVGLSFLFPEMSGVSTTPDFEP
jgi:hypothetical protein